jgi:hypothetical protein
MTDADKCFKALAELKAKGFPIPPALANNDEPRPLALSTHSDVNDYVALHGFGADEARLLDRAIGSLVRTPRYQEALAADLSMRFAITGEPVEPVSETDRLSASLLINAKALRSIPASLRPTPSQPPKPSPSLSPFRNGGSLSTAEIERRKQALAALNPGITSHGQA